MSASTPAPDPVHVLALLHAHDLDGAIEAGLMRLDAAATGLPAGDALQLQAVQARLRGAWEARERHLRRARRLADRAARRHTPASVAAEPVGDAVPTVPAVPAVSAVPAVPGLPPAAAAALARARARAATGS